MYYGSSLKNPILREGARKTNISGRSELRKRGELGQFADLGGKFAKKSG